MRFFRGSRVRRKYARWGSQLLNAGWPLLPPLPLSVQPRDRAWALVVPLAGETLQWEWVEQDHIKSPFDKQALGQTREEDRELRSLLVRAMLLTEQSRA